QTTNDQKLAMVMFIENPENRNIIDGKAVTGLPISGKPVTKNARYAQMALFVNKRCKDSNWDAKIANEKDHENGINTIEAKLEDLCPYYSRIDIIYENNDNSNDTQVQKNNLSNYNSSDNINKEKGLENNNNSNNIQDQRNNLFNFNNNNDIDNKSELENDELKKTSLSFILDEFTLNDDDDDLIILNHK
ncbi:22540_t:CDS:2, partial [Dentiscutata erythropus]